MINVGHLTPSLRKIYSAKEGGSTFFDQHPLQGGVKYYVVNVNVIALTAYLSYLLVTPGADRAPAANHRSKTHWRHTHRLNQ